MTRAMISRQRLACPYGSGAAVDFPSAASGPQAVMVRSGPTRTAREQPTMGSQTEPVENSWRDMAGEG